MKFVDFMQDLKRQEMELYRKMIDEVKKEYNKFDKNIIENDPFKFWKYIDENICADYDVHQMFRKEVFNENNYTNIERDIDEHISKLQKSILKVTGENADIEQAYGSDTEYIVKGIKADYNIKVTLPKLSSTKNVMKARIKGIKIIEHKQPKEKKNTQYEDSIYVKQWKEKELVGYKTALENWKKQLKELEQDAENKKSILVDMVNQYKQNHNGILPQVENGEYTDTELHDAARTKKVAEDKYIDYKYNSNRFFFENGFSADFEEKCKKEINKHFEQLQAKVENKIGRIIEINDLGGDDYAFVGEKDKCVVEVIWAGGYNIQRLHTRWIVKNWNLDE